MLRTLWARTAGSALGAVEALFGDTRGYAIYRGGFLIEAQDVERAILYLHARLDRWPDAPWLHYHAGRAAQQKGLHRLARVRFAHAAALAPEEATFRFALGYALRHEGFFAAAAREYRQALASVPGDPRILFNLGVVERERGELDAAYACFEAVSQRWPRHARVHYTLGICAYEQGDRDTAAVALRRALKLDRKHHKALYQLALIELDQDRVRAGRKKLDRVLELNPSYGPAHYAFGRSLVEESPTVARRHLQESILGQPAVPRAHLDLGRLYEAAGHLAEARREYLLYQRHFPQRRATWIARRLAALDPARRAR